VFWGATLGKTENYNKAKVLPGSGVKNDAYVHKIHVKNSDIEISEAGEINIYTHDSGEEHECRMNLTDSGLITIDSTSMVKITSSQISIEASEQLDLRSKVINMQGLDDEQSTQIRLKSASLECDCSDGGVIVKTQFGNDVI